MAETLYSDLRPPLPTLRVLLIVTTVISLVFMVYYLVAFSFIGERPIPDYDLIGVMAGDSSAEAKQRYYTSSRAILQEGLAKVCNYYIDTSDLRS